MSANLDDTLRAMVREIIREELARTRAEPAEAEGFMSTTDAARYADVAIGTIRRWIREGKLPAHHAGRHLRVRRDDLEELLVGERHERDLSPEELARRAFSR